MFSCTIIVFIALVVVRQTVVVLRNTPKKNRLISRHNNGSNFYFEDLNKKKPALVYHTMCFLMRLSFSLILVFLKGEPIIQVFAMMHVQLTFVGYLVAVLPFNSKK